MAERNVLVYTLDSTTVPSQWLCGGPAMVCLRPSQPQHPSSHSFTN